MNFFDALATIQKEFPSLDESELRSAMDSEVAAEMARLAGQRARAKYARAVEAAAERITGWLRNGAEDYRVKVGDIDSLARFVGSHRPACVWAVLRSMQLAQVKQVNQATQSDAESL